MKHQKIILKILAIVLSITNLLNVIPVKTYAADKLIDNFQSNDTVVSEKIKSNGGLICVTAVCTIVFYKLFSKLCRELYMFLLNPIVKEIECNFIKESYEREFEGQIEKNILTKRQEGVGWCWIACLQGLLKEKEIEKSQEEIFKEITGKKPGWFEHTRNECLSPFENIEEAKNSPYGYIYNSNNYVYLGQIKNYVSNVTSGKYEFKVEFFNMTMKTKVDDVCQKIKEIYKNNNNHPFIIMDSCQIPHSHAVNVVEIDKNDDIVIECPDTEIRRTEPLKNFVERYRFRGLTNIIKEKALPDGLPIYYLSPTA